VAGLRHKNVVQIYDVGEADGRPYFTMEFIDGDSLARRLAGTPQPARRAAELVATLAGAVQAAHACGIVHRDLKPANVLLTADDTPMIVDFGLARQADDGAGLTLTGVPVGTPSYMAPEQARGCRDAIGPAVDVYALGAILYELLTGRPPFRADTAAATLHLVVNGEPLPLSRRNARVPRDLETICLKCLEKDPGKRYPTAAALATDLERFLKHEPIQARAPRRVERCVRWTRRRPVAAVLLAAVAVLAAAGTVGGWWLYQQQAAVRARQALTDREVRGIVARARVLLEGGWRTQNFGELTEAGAEANRAADIARSGGASAAVQEEAVAFQETAAGRRGRAEKNRALQGAILDVTFPQETSTHVPGEAGRLFVLAQQSVDEQFAEAFRRWGMDVDRTAEDEVVARLRQEPDGVVQELIAGLDAWMLERWWNHSEEEWRRLARVADRLDRSEQHRRLRALLVGDAPPRAEAVAALVGAGSPWPALWELTRGNAWRRLREVRREIDPRKEPVLTVLLLARASLAAGDVAGAEEVLRQASVARPGQVVLLNVLGKLLERQGPAWREEAIGYYRAARGQRPSLGVALSHALARAGRAPQGEDVLRDLARQQPENPDIHFYLGLNLAGQRKLDAAEAAYRRAIALKPDFAAAHHNLGNVLNGRQRYAEAESSFRKAFALRPALVEAHTNLANTLYRQKNYREAEAAHRQIIALRPEFAGAHHNLGNALQGQGKLDEALAAYARAIALQPDYAEAHNNLGNVLNERQRYGEAEAAYCQAIALKPDFAAAFSNLGNTLLRQGKHADAEAAYRKAVALKPEEAGAWYALGVALARQGKDAAAEAAYRKVTGLRPAYTEAWYNLGSSRALQGKYRAAEAAYRKAVALQPDFARAYHNLGNSLRAQARYGEAATALRRAIAVEPGFALAYNNLGITLIALARFDEAAAVLKKGAALLPERAPLREQARQLLQSCQRFAALDARLPLILEGTEKPADAAEQVEFARLCHFKKRYAAAARLYAEAFATKPPLAEGPHTGHRYNAACCAALAGCGHDEDEAGWGDAERARWRAQARRWLRAELDAWGKILESGPAAGRAQVRMRLAGWREDSDLAGLREPDALDKLSPAERQDCRTLWSDLDALLRRARPSR
jgi:serine/threonine-protein kinase